MTYERWKQIERLQWDKALREAPTINRRRLAQKLHRAMISTHGKCPPKPGLGIKEKAGLWFLRRKLNSALEDKEIEMSPFLKKLIVSAVYGVGACGATIQLALVDNVIQGNEWGAIASAFIAAFWGTFKSNTTAIMPSRKGETVTGTGPGM